MKYSPTPRDLFNPPPQAPEVYPYPFLENIWDVRSRVWDTCHNSSSNDIFDLKEIFLNLISLLEELDERTGDLR